MRGVFRIVVTLYPAQVEVAAEPPGKSLPLDGEVFEASGGMDSALARAAFPWEENPGRERPTRALSGWCPYIVTDTEDSRSSGAGGDVVGLAGRSAFSVNVSAVPVSSARPRKE
jgi:hypothetical protein